MNNLIAPEQYGCRKGKSAIEHILNKRFSYDIIQQLQCPGALCSNDAKSCNDRILYVIVLMVFQRLGITYTPVQYMIYCIQQMKKYMGTHFGDLEEFFTSKYTAIPFKVLYKVMG